MFDLFEGWRVRGFGADAWLRTISPTSRACRPSCARCWRTPTRSWRRRGAAPDSLGRPDRDRRRPGRVPAPVRPAEHRGGGAGRTRRGRGRLAPVRRGGRRALHRSGPARRALRSGKPVVVPVALESEAGSESAIFVYASAAMAFPLWRLPPELTCRDPGECGGGADDAGGAG
ncbi:hypothetical protein ACRAWD_29810 [Caulobacter segnis]